jgi:hypothetical protein
MYFRGPGSLFKKNAFMEKDPWDIQKKPTLELSTP